MTLGPVRVMVAGVVVLLCVLEVSDLLFLCYLMADAHWPLSQQCVL